VVSLRVAFLIPLPLLLILLVVRSGPGVLRTRVPADQAHQRVRVDDLYVRSESVDHRHHVGERLAPGVPDDDRVAGG
jgi:hypothetical protein